LPPTVFAGMLVLMGVTAPTALIVEDDDSIRDILEVVARGAGFETVCARDGQEALQYLRAVEQLPNVVLLDLMMPVLNGWQFLEQREPRLLSVPVVVLSAKSAPGLPPDVRVLKKPITMELVLDAIVPYAR
jgi:CheY-like chemotaxis protein